MVTKSENVTQAEDVYIWFYFPLLKVLKILLSIVLVFFIIFSLTFGLEEGLLRPFGYGAYVDLSESMLPIIKRGDLIIVQKQDSYKIGEIITYKLNPETKETITHRIVEIKQIDGNTVFVTKGDYNNEKDNWPILSSFIQGKYVTTIPVIGDLVIFTRTIEGIILLIIVPASALLTLQLQSIYNYFERKYKTVKA